MLGCQTGFYRSDVPKHAGLTGVGLEEGIAINQSLSALGQCLLVKTRQKCWCFLSCVMWKLPKGLRSRGLVQLCKGERAACRQLVRD